MEFLIATSNQHKVQELRRLLPATQLLTPSDSGLTFEYEETADSYRENALGKAMSLHLATGAAVIADDSGLEVDALGGAPGVRSARYGSDEGAVLDSQQRNLLLLLLLQGVANREAAFICCVAVVFSDQRFYIIQESMPGRIATAPAGKEGFGYDPVFEVPDLGRTAAQLSAEQKDRYSHRGQAIRSCARLLGL